MSSSVLLVDRTPNGAPVYSCSCGKTWLQFVNALGVKQGIIKTKFDIWQGGYRNNKTAASAGTHNGGGVFDFAQNDSSTLKLMRMGGSACWYRNPATTRLSGENHCVLIGCPHHPSADYQITAYKAGYDGLGDGYKHPDPYWRPSPIPTWSMGVVWMKKELGLGDFTMADASKILSAIENSRKQIHGDLATTQNMIIELKRILNDMNSVENPATGQKWRMTRAMWSVWAYVLKLNGFDLDKGKKK